jgi:hypothetical protein
MSGIKRSLVVTLTALFTGLSAAHAAELKVTFTNNAPSGGTYLTPAWVGFHDGSFDAFSPGSLASAGIEAISEDGNVMPLAALFAGSGIDSVAGGAPIAPGETVTTMLSVASGGSNDYFSFASMVLPSSDFFIGNDNPKSTSIAGLLDGTFSSITLSVIGVFDSGTEVNDFASSAGNPLFPIGLPAGQSGPNEGADEGGFIAFVTGTPYGGYANVGGADLSSLDFTGYESIATFTISAVPVPAALPLLLSALGGLGFMHRRGASAT